MVKRRSPALSLSSSNRKKRSAPSAPSAPGRSDQHVSDPAIGPTAAPKAVRAAPGMADDGFRARDEAVRLAMQTRIEEVRPYVEAALAAIPCRANIDPAALRRHADKLTPLIASIQSSPGARTRSRGTLLVDTLKDLEAKIVASVGDHAINAALQAGRIAIARHPATMNAIARAKSEEASSPRAIGRPRKTRGTALATTLLTVFDDIAERQASISKKDRSRGWAREGAFVRFVQAIFSLVRLDDDPAGAAERAINQSVDRGQRSRQKRRSVRG